MIHKALLVQYRKLGRTGLDVSVLSFGASSLGGVFHAVDEGQAIRTVHAAVGLGINFIDTSPFYGLTKSEAVLGKALRTMARDKVILATKVGRYGDAAFDFSAQRITASVDESLSRLGVDHVDLIQCHDMEFVPLDQIVEESLPALQKIVAAGKARFIGITGLPLKVFTEVIGRAEPGVVDTILSYCHFELNDTTLAPLAADLVEMGVGVINASPTGMGLLTERGAPGWHPAPAEIKRVCVKAVEHCKARGKSITDLAMQFSVSDPNIATTLVSTATPAHIEHNVAAVEAPMDEQLLAEVLDILAPIADQTWPSGLPENN